ncbi:MAG: DNA-protecting protein DprA [Proteobacteria bacterium]|nr:DNA-protecting protein DprA [Pseudomonadota bacterium]
MNHVKTLLALWLVPGIGPKKIQTLCEHFSNIELIKRAKVKELSQLEGINQTIAEEIVRAFDSKGLKRELELIEKSDVKLLGLTDPLYSQSLREIANPPPVLYIKGEIDLNKGIPIAFVGSRKASYTGKSFCKQIIKELARQLPDTVVVSGLALGIDSVAHQAALENNLKTIAVLGSGLNQIYPSQNKKLSQEIIHQGALVSEFPLLTKPNAGNFPLRNRIVSGLSKGVLVVEAGEKSGALITAAYTLEQNRELFAMPGLPDSKFYLGNNRLIQKGHAKLILEAGDIVEEILTYQQLDIFNTSKKNIENVESVEIDESEKKIITLLREGEFSKELLSQRLDISLPKLLAALTTLEMKEIILSKPGAIYQINPTYGY